MGLTPATAVRVARTSFLVVWTAVKVVLGLMAILFSVEAVVALRGIVYLGPWEEPLIWAAAAMAEAHLTQAF